jgi:hypothetical protein
LNHYHPSKEQKSWLSGAGFDLILCRGPNVESDADLLD